MTRGIFAEVYRRYRKTGKRVDTANRRELSQAGRAGTFTEGEKLAGRGGGTYVRPEKLGQPPNRY
jgi:hypothetical protein